MTYCLCLAALHPVRPAWRFTVASRADDLLGMR